MEQLEMYQTGIAITMACNLKCRLCSNYAPYYAHLAYHSLDYLKEMMRRYFTVVTRVRKLMFTGGEPLLHPAHVWQPTGHYSPDGEGSQYGLHHERQPGPNGIPEGRDQRIGQGRPLL